MVLAAGAAGSGEGQLAGLNLTAGFLRCVSAKLLGNFHPRQIHDRPAGLTDKVDMGRGIGIEPLDPIDCAETGDQPLLLKEGEVAVDRAQGDIRELRFHLSVDPLC